MEDVPYDLPAALGPCSTARRARFSAARFDRPARPRMSIGVVVNSGGCGGRHWWSTLAVYSRGQLCRCCWSGRPAEAQRRPAELVAGAGRRSTPPVFGPPRVPPPARNKRAHLFRVPSCASQKQSQGFGSHSEAVCPLQGKARKSQACQVYVRMRPMFEKEWQQGEFEAVTAFEERVGACSRFGGALTGSDERRIWLQLEGGGPPHIAIYELLVQAPVQQILRCIPS